MLVCTIIMYTESYQTNKIVTFNYQFSSLIKFSVEHLGWSLYINIKDK